MNRKIAVVGAAIALGAAALVGGGIAVAGGDAGEDTDQPITDDAALQQATQAALDHLGEGRVTGTEVGDEESTYEIEVTLDDGSQVDVQLDAGFEVVSTEGDHEEPGDDD